MPNATFQTLSIRVQGTSVRKEQFQGREHLVVPIVALVEGILQGGNSEFPELALASEFSKAPQGWNGRPITFDHPKVNGQFVSVAQSPDVFQKEVLGFLFNSKVEDKKLKTEAWIDLSAVAKAPQEIQDGIARLQSDKASTVEVSTGLFTAVEKTPGKFNNEDYGGIWREIVPDHLAILPEGVRGACSIDDGCGAPRSNNLKTNCGEEKVEKKLNKLLTFLKEKIGLSVSEDGTITLEANSETRPNNKEEGMSKEQMIAGLIANKATSFEQADEAWLKTLSEEQLQKLEPKVQEETAEEKTAREAQEAEAAEVARVQADAEKNKKKKAMDPAAYVADAPAEIQEVLNEGLKMQRDRKQALIKGLKANKRNEYTEDELKAMSLGNLERLAKLADVPDFTGRAGGTIQTNSEDDAEAIPAMPAVFVKKQ